MRRVCGVALAAMVLSCSTDGDSSGAGPSPLPSDMPATVTMIVSAYTLPGTGSLSVTVPQQLVCMPTDTVLPETSSTARLRFNDDSMFVSLVELVPLIRRITLGPSFSPDIGSILNTVDALGSSAAMVECAFARMETGTGIVGMWRFAGLAPAIVQSILLPDQREALEGIVADDSGRAVLIFDFGPTTLTGMFNRAVYGDATLEQVLDTSVARSRLSDSTWQVYGADTTNVGINQDGDITYTRGDSSYTYYLHPASCPDPVAPSWL